MFLILKNTLISKITSSITTIIFIVVSPESWWHVTAPRFKPTNPSALQTPAPSSWRVGEMVPIKKGPTLSEPTKF